MMITFKLGQFGVAGAQVTTSRVLAGDESVIHALRQSVVAIEVDRKETDYWGATNSNCMRQ